MTRQKSGAKPGKPKSGKSNASQKTSADEAAPRPARTARATKRPLVNEAARRPAAARRSAGNSRLAPGHSYADVLEYLANFESRSNSGGVDLRQTLVGDALDQLQHSHAGLPADYVEYLREVGWGSLLRCRYTVYRQLMPAAERFGKQVAARWERRVLCFGDNLSGDVAGFLPDQDWAVVEIGHMDFSIHVTGQTFGRFIRERMGLDGAEG
jgi:hypothetical protein